MALTMYNLAALACVFTFATVTTGNPDPHVHDDTLCLTSNQHNANSEIFLTQLCINSQTGDILTLTVGNDTYTMAPGSGTQLKDCNTTGVPRIQSTPSTITVTREFVCNTSTLDHNALAISVDVFTIHTSSGSIQWNMTLSSTDADVWTTDITSSLGYQSWVVNNDTGSHVWVGGPPRLAAVSAEETQFYNPLAPFDIVKTSQPSGGINAEKQGASQSRSTSQSWYIANDYNAVYGQMVNVKGKFYKFGITSTSSECQTVCSGNTSCTIYVWSASSHSCWWRLDTVWGAQNTLVKEEGRVSGCLLGSDSKTGTPYVNGCGTNPIAGNTQSSTIYFYGGQQNNIGDPKQVNVPATIIPVLTKLPSSNSTRSGAGISLVQSPNDTPIVAFASTLYIPRTNTGWLNFTRRYHRFGGVGSVHEALPIKFSADFIGHSDCWRPAVQWMQDEYPTFFEPNASATATAQKVFGAGAYADSRGPSDINANDAQHYKEMGYMMNWDSTARFPWHGEWMPTAADGFGEEWVSCFAHARPDHHTDEGCMNVSYATINTWYENQRSLGLHTCAYGNLFEFGWNVETSYNRTIDCSKEAIAKSNEQQLLCHTQQLIKNKYGAALVFQPSVNGANKLLCGGLDGSCIMDPNPDLPYLEHVVDMARTSIARAPSSGVCIDRQDWLGHVNPDADDHLTLLIVDGVYVPVRALISSWKPAMKAFADVWHNAGQVVIINDHSNRLDMMEQSDGIYAEMGDMETSGMMHAVGSALACMNGPVYIWNHPKSDSTLTPEYVRAGLMGHVHLGVFPMIPVKNNDHGIGGDCAPTCVYDDTFIEFGAMFVVLRQRRWVLAAHAVVVTATSPGVALVNAFSANANNVVGAHGSRSYVVAVTFAPQLGSVAMALNIAGVNSVLACASNCTSSGCDGVLSVAVVQPGDVVNETTGQAAPGSFSPNSCTLHMANTTRGCAMVSKAPRVESKSLLLTLAFGITTLAHTSPLSSSSSSTSPSASSSSSSSSSLSSLSSASSSTQSSLPSQSPPQQQTNSALVILTCDQRNL